MSSISFYLNGRQVSPDVEPSTPLLYVLRNELELNGPKFGCGLQQCGACMVLLDGTATPSCMLPVAAAEGKGVVSLEGLAREDGSLHPVQQAFIDEQAVQCGYCLNGMVIHAVSLLDENPDASDSEIRKAMDKNICRCGTHSRILKAIQKARRS
ncbi:(2Fe-2S)-binding protein [Gramella sp. GC03-9]|uniref:(2Fe-2S)-binding protein n=1 Tax=Christiangramia oceanisediminis TaxID=2920386 RepID=A0A9X2KX81_9FLAO|nr:(2Fe-2S)-binding protein [Gramella oceanisediminis]MCP9198496.1 (2Fe-2S)-binding protein [Gramella oceanisediminis]